MFLSLLTDLDKVMCQASDPQPLGPLPPLSSNNIVRFKGSVLPTVPEVSRHIDLPPDPSSQHRPCTQGSLPLGYSKCFRRTLPWFMGHFPTVQPPPTVPFRKLPAQ